MAEKKQKVFFIDEEVWKQFRSLAILRGTSATQLVGKLVEQEVARQTQEAQP